MKIIEVKDKKSWRAFHNVPHTVYKNDRNWIAPLEGDIENIFNPEENLSLKHGDAQCFVLLNEKDKPVGRVAAFIDYEGNKRQTYPIGGIGFFECIENFEFAKALFEKASDYLASKGAQIIEGPINFGERDKYWGLLVHGFEPPIYQENYHPPYYERFFLEWGFIPFEQIYTMMSDSVDLPVERFGKIAERLTSRQNVRAEYFDFKYKERFAADFTYIYNNAFDKYDHFKQIEKHQILKVIEQSRIIADTKTVVTAYWNDEPAAFIACFPDVNPILKSMNGKMQPWKIPIFLMRKNLQKTFTAKGVIFGVIPKFASKGVYSLLISALCIERNLKKYPQIAVATVRAHNEQAASMYAKMGPRPRKVHLTLRKSLAPGVPIQPFPIKTIEEIKAEWKIE